MKALTHLALAGVLIGALVGCSLLIPKETLYLRSAQGQATQDEVQQRLGRPSLVSSTQAGEAVWVYQIREEEPGSRWTSIGMRCDEYVLTFDAGGVLRRWTYQTYVHGGELMPMYCVPGGMDDKRNVRG
jgi:outer membrane protein assembly factor BamE (lipoprotein component of BamABCDE complex)